MATFINTTDEGFDSQLNNFCNKIDTYNTLLGVSAGQVTAIKLDRDNFHYAVHCAQLIDSYKQTVTAWKNLLRYGNKAEILPAFPAQPTLPAAPAAVDANVQGRFAALIQQIVANTNYTTSIGEDLGIVAPVSPFNPNDGKPEFKIEFSSGGHPNLKWKKGKFQGVEIWKCIDGKTWARLDKDFSPDFIDKSELPPAGQSAVWNYKMIYLYKDEVVGKYSAEQSVTVYGAV